MPRRTHLCLRLIRTSQEKLEILREIEERQGHGQSLRGICRDLDIQPCQARKWKSAAARLTAARPSRCSFASGRPSLLQAVKDELVTWFLQMREQGIIISVRLVIIRASSPDFRRKSDRAKGQIVRRFLASQKITIRSITHTGQHPPDAVVKEAKEFVTEIQEHVVGDNRDHKYVLNMDQTPAFDMSSGRTLNTVVGEKYADSQSLPMKCSSACTNSFRCQRCRC